MPINKKNPDFSDLTSFEVKLKQTDLTEKVLDLKVFQDMFCPYTLGTLLLHDTTSLVDKIKLGDVVTIKMETKQGFKETDGKFEFALSVYDIKHRFSDKDRSQMFVLELASNQFMRDISTRLIQTFDNQPVIGIVQECLSKVGGAIENVIDTPPTNKISMVCPNIAPLVALNMALRYTTPSTDYFCVPTRIQLSANNAYTLLSLSDLMKREKVAIFNQDMFNRDSSRYKNQNLQFRNPLIQPVDNLMSVLAGYNASTLSTMDVFKRKWEKKDKRFMGNVDAKSHIAYMPVVSQSFDKGQSLPETAKDWLAQRKNNFLKLIQTPVVFSTFGFCKSHEWLAKPFELHLHNHDVNIRNNNANQLFKGEKFLCTAVTHHVNQHKVYRNSWRFVNWNFEHNQG